MEIYLLILMLLFFLLFQICICKIKIFSPTVLLTLCFFISTINLVTMKNTWDTTIQLRTVIIIMMGILFFSLACFLASISIKGGKLKIKKTYAIERKNYIIDGLEKLCNKKLLMFCFFVFNILSSGAYAYFSIRYATSYVAGGSLLYLLAYTQDLQKFSNASFDVPILISLSFSVCRFSTYIWGILYIQRIFTKKKENGLIALCLLSSLIGQLCVGARGAVVSTILGLGIYFLFENNKYKKFHFKIKYVVVIVISVTAFMFAFDYYARITHRITNDYSMWEYISIYLGAPILNLDYVLKTKIIHSSLFGKNTLSGMYSWISNRFGFTFSGMSTSLGFRESYNHTLGNVYTIFGYLFIDFDYLGTYIYMLIIGFLNQVIYNAAKKNQQNNSLSISTLLYMYCAPLVFLSFFSNRFAENVISVDFLHGFVAWVIVIFVLNKFSFKKLVQ